MQQHTYVVSLSVELHLFQDFVLYSSSKLVNPNIKCQELSHIMSIIYHLHPKFRVHLPSKIKAKVLLIWGERELKVQTLYAKLPVHDNKLALKSPFSFSYSTFGIYSMQFKSKELLSKPTK